MTVYNYAQGGTVVSQRDDRIISLLQLTATHHLTDKRVRRAPPRSCLSMRAEVHAIARSRGWYMGGHPIFTWVRQGGPFDHAPAIRITLAPADIQAPTRTAPHGTILDGRSEKGALKTLSRDLAEARPRSMPPTPTLSMH
jgi:hypothetical protein